MFTRNMFVTNSSSTHCIVTGVKCEMHDDILPWEGNLDGKFGWEEFLLVSKKMKRLYIAVAMLKASDPSGYEESKHSLSRRIKEVNEFFGEEILNPWTTDVFGYYIDHQSEIQKYPYYMKGGIFEEDARAFADYIINSPDVAIVGGNDNEMGMFHPVEGNYESTDNAYRRWEKQRK